MTATATALPLGPMAPPSDLVDLDVERELDSHRRELTAYCYRMLGSGSEAEDAVQETLLRAWKAMDRFEGRSSVRSWLYKIATNVCLDMLRTPQRRARPMELGGPVSADEPPAATLPEHMWVTPIADDRVIPVHGDPAELAASRESVRLAFVAALQHLPSRQRAVLILREVLRWQATEVAELLDTTVASVNSALQRARATLAECDIDELDPTGVDPAQQAMLEQYVDAFERYDVDRARGAAPRRRPVLDAPAQHVARGARPGRDVAQRPRHRLQGLAPRRHRGQRVRRLRELPAHPARACTSPSPSRSSSSQTGGSPGSTTSSTPRSSHEFGLPARLEG